MSSAPGGEGPQFDDTRRALSFALNFQGATKAPLISRMMAQVRVAPRRVGKRRKARFLAQFDHDITGQLRALGERVLEGDLVRTRSRGPSPPPVRGLDAAHLAGYILAQFERLDADQQTVLRGLTLRPYDPCSCKSSCCSGRKKNPHWARAVDLTALLLRGLSPGPAQPGRPHPGLSTPPAMRLMIVMDFYERRKRTVGELSDEGKVSLTTAAKHRELIVAHLGRIEDEAWAALDEIFDQSGVTGALE